MKTMFLNYNYSFAGFCLIFECTVFIGHLFLQQGVSISENWAMLDDNGTNYCTLHNLIDGENTWCCNMLLTWYNTAFKMMLHCGTSKVAKMILLFQTVLQYTVYPALLSEWLQMSEKVWVYFLSLQEVD